MRLSSTTVTIVSALKSVSASDPLSNIKNGNINDYFATSIGSSTSIQIDLGSIVTNIKSIKFWHYWQDSRTYYSIQLMISTDGSRWKRIYGPSTDIQSSSGTEILFSSLNPSLPYFIIPSSYSFDKEPHTNYADTGNIELIDGIIAGTYFPTGSTTRWVPWVGWITDKSISMTFRFGRNVSISKVSIHFQGDHVGGIYLPIDVTVSNTAFPIGDLNRNGWFDMSGSWSGDSLIVKFNVLFVSTVAEWLFISEVMFTESATSFYSSFALCTSIKAIVIPTSVIFINTNTFFGCISLTHVTISSGVTSIGSLAFGFTGINTLSIPNSVVSLGSYILIFFHIIIAITIIIN